MSPRERLEARKLKEDIAKARLEQEKLRVELFALKSKAPLEEEKIHAEIRSLRKWWVPFVTTSATILSIVAGTIITYNNSEFKRQAEISAGKVTSANAELSNIKSERNRAKQDAETTKAQVASAKAELKIALSERDRAKQEKRLAKSVAASARAERDDINRKTLALRKQLDAWRTDVSTVERNLRSLSTQELTGLYRNQPVLRMSQLNSQSLKLKQVTDAMLKVLGQEKEPTN